MTQALAEVLNGSCWLMEQNAMRAMLARALAITPQEVDAARVSAAAISERAQAPQMVGDVAVISMSGPVVYKMSWFSALFGCASIEGMRDQFRAALADPATRTIVFRCDTPGGVVDMVQEFADEIYATRGKKPVLFVADTMIASAGYWLASQGDAIYATNSSMIGSIGTYLEHQDISAMLEQLGIKITLIAHPAKKVEGNSYEPLSDAARASLQTFVDEIGNEFETAVMRGRGVSRAKVTEWTQLGIPPRGKRAIGLGLADRDGTFEALIAKLTSQRRGVGRAFAQVDGWLAASADALRLHDGDVAVEGETVVAGTELVFSEAVQSVSAEAQEEVTAEVAEPGAAAVDEAALQADQDAIDITLALSE